MKEASVIKSADFVTDGSECDLKLLEQTGIGPANRF